MGLLEIFLVIVAGFTGGLLGGQVGAGALIIIPALLLVGISPAMVVGTSMLSGWLINVSAALRYLKSHRSELNFVLPYALLALAGAIFGSYVNLAVDEEILKRVIAAMLFLPLTFVIFKKDAGLIDAERYPSPLFRKLFIPISFLLGAYGGFFSVGVTTFFVYVFVLGLGKSFVKSMAASVFMASIFLFGSFVYYAVLGAIQWDVAVILAISSFAGAWIGARIAIKKGDVWIKWLFGSVVIAMTVKLLLGL